ncbi:MAG: PilZ domain-containing protein [bacterium]|nr:PilZ domain-containing protein [bacterium]
MSCDLTVGDSRHVGVVLDLSPRGFFVQTGASVDIGAKVDVALCGRDGAMVEVEAVVTNRRKIPPQLASVARGGLGCCLKTTPEDYYRLLANISPA